MEFQRPVHGAAGMGVQVKLQSAVYGCLLQRKKIHLSTWCFKGCRPALLPVYACPANAAFGVRAELAYGGAGGCDPCISGYF